MLVTIDRVAVNRAIGLLPIFKESTRGMLLGEGVLANEVDRVIELAQQEIQERQSATTQADVSATKANDGHAQAELSAATAAPTTIIPQPNANGEFASPLDGALWMAMTWKIPQTPLRGKAAFLDEWPKHASTDPAQIKQWAQQYSGCNFGSVAKSGSAFVFEVDSPEVLKRFPNFTSELIVKSRPGRGHRYYKFVPGIENIGQNATLYGDFSLRVDDEYCVSPGSIHPERHTQYTVKVSKGLVEPTPAEITFWNSEKKVKTGSLTANDNGEEPFPQGTRNSSLTSLLGRARQVMKMDAEQLFAYGLDVNEKRCVPPLPESEVKIIVDSIARYEIKNTSFPMLHAGKPIELNPQNSPTKHERDFSAVEAYPEFPVWAIQGTPLYEEFCKPAADASSKFPELIWMPAMMLLLNYASLKVCVGVNDIFNLYLGIIGKSGTFKSSSCELAMKYFEYAGVLNPTANEPANGRIVVDVPGSAEGYGLNLAKIKADHSIMWYDELKRFTDKIKGRDNSSTLLSNMLLIYESGAFKNRIKRNNESFDFPSGSYCFGWLWCCTDEAFPEQWQMMQGQRSGLNNRMFFCSTPDKPKTLVLDQTDHALMMTSALQFRTRIEKAIVEHSRDKGGYHYEDMANAQYLTSKLDSARAASWLEKFALGLAIDMGLPEIDNDCLERAYAIVQYGLQVARLIDPGEAETREARIENLILKALRFQHGEMTYRELERKCHASRFGMKLWWSCVQSLVAAEKIEIEDTGISRMVYLLR